jgi:hypothetical protein
MGILALVFLAVALWAVISGEAWWAGRWVRRLREPRPYWISIGTCVVTALLIFALGPLR